MSFQIVPSQTSRRTFLKGLGATGALTVIGSAGSPMVAYAMQGGASDTVIVNLFLRGGADGLDIVVPHGDDEYYNRRPNLGLTSSDYDDLGDGFFGLNSTFSPLLSHYTEGRLAFVHASGNPLYNARSHFVAQPRMDFAEGQTGWLQRALMAGNFPQASSGLSFGGSTSGSLVGPWSGASLLSIQNALNAGAALSPARPALEAMYAPAPALESSAVNLAMASLDDLAMSNPMLSNSYPNTGISNFLRQAAGLIKTDLGIRGIAINYGGWDHHVNLRNEMTGVGTQLSEGLAAFQTDLGSLASKVVVVVMTEFGREAIENGTGTDHGHGGLMMVLGEPLTDHGGGQVHLTGPWPGLAIDDLDRGRFLDVTTDYRSVLAELVEHHLGVSDIGSVFPGYAQQAVGVLGAAPPVFGDVDGSGAADDADVMAILNQRVGNAVGFGIDQTGDLNGDGQVDVADALHLARINAAGDG